MKRHRPSPVFSLESWGIRTKNRLQNLQQYLIALSIAIIIPISATASITCEGHFVNPVTDICWSCIMPISIGGINIGKGASPKKRDRANPSSPLCLCNKSGVPVPGVSIGFWEPVRLVDVTRTPYCMVNLCGITFGSDDRKISSSERGYNRRSTHTSFYHVHYYIYPLIYWLELLTDFLCLEEGTVDVAYMSEFDITWNDPKLQSLLNPEAILFGNPIAQSACVLDCAASTFDMPLDPGTREWGTLLRVFVSNSMSKSLLQAYAKAAKDYGAVLVFNGLPNGSWRELSKLVTEISGDNPEYVAMQIDDEAFSKFGITEVPSFVLSKEENVFATNQVDSLCHKI